MITIKTEEEIAILREGGKRLAEILSAVAKEVRPGVSTKSLDDLAKKLVAERGDSPAFLNYKPDGAMRPYPASVCVSINDEIVHGIPNESEKIIKEGDVVGLDMGLVHKGFVTDSAVTVIAGSGDNKAKRLLQATKDALSAGIAAARGGSNVSKISSAIEESAKASRFSVADDLGGHGVGYSVHEDPYIPNVKIKGFDAKLVPGMVIAIEPMLNEGGSKIKIDRDGWTIKTADGKRSAHFEHTILITSGEAEILTA